MVLPCYLTTNPAGAQFFLLRHKLGRALKKEGTAYAARPQKTTSPARHPVLLRRVLLVLCILAVLWLGYSCMMPQLLFSARGTMIFVPDPPLRR